MLVFYTYLLPLSQERAISSQVNSARNLPFCFYITNFNIILPAICPNLPSLYFHQPFPPQNLHTFFQVIIRATLGLDSSVGIGTTTVWKVRGSNSDGKYFSAPIQTGPGIHQASRTIGIGSISLRVKRSERGVEHPPQSSTEFKVRVNVYYYSSSGHVWPVSK